IDAVTGGAAGAEKPLAIGSRLLRRGRERHEEEGGKGGDGDPSRGHPYPLAINAGPPGHRTVWGNGRGGRLQGRRPSVDGGRMGGACRRTLPPARLFCREMYRRLPVTEAGQRGRWVQRQIAAGDGPRCEGRAVSATFCYTFFERGIGRLKYLGGVERSMEPTPHIAVVDDHRDIRDLVGKYLAQHGYRISVAENAAALRRLLERSAPDLVVLDIMMPGEDGLSVCRQLRSTTDLPIILLTAMAE